MSSTDPATAAVQAVAAGQDAVVTRTQVLHGGMAPHVVRRLLREGVWAPLLRGTYLVDPWRTEVALQRSWARAAVLAVPGSAVALSAAAALHGLAGAPRAGVVDLVVPHRVERRPGVVPHRFVLGEGDAVDLGGIPATSVVRTLADLVPRLSRLDALAVLDSALAREATDVDGLAAAARLAGARRGCRAVADLWALADGRAESPLESRARLRCLESGLTPDDLQFEVRSEHGHVLARADMVFNRRTRRGALPLLLEADGRDVHSTPEALHRDRWRHNTLVALGYETVRCTWADTLSRGAVPRMVRRAL